MNGVEIPIGTIVGPTYESDSYLIHDINKNEITFFRRASLDEVMAVLTCRLHDGEPRSVAEARLMQKFYDRAGQLQL